MSRSSVSLGFVIVALVLCILQLVVGFDDVMNGSRSIGRYLTMSLGPLSLALVFFFHHRQTKPEGGAD